MNRQELLAQLVQRQQDIVNAARNENRSLTEAEQRDFDDAQRQIDALNAAPENTPAPAPDDSQQRAVADERARASEIYGICRDFNIDPAPFINNGSTVDAVRAAVLAQLRSNGAPINGRAAEGTPHVETEATGEDNFRRDASDALLIRSARVNPDNPTQEARAMSAMSLRDLAIECLTREGKSSRDMLRMAPDMLYNELCRQFYNPTAAFPAILDSTIEKSIVKLYNMVPTTFQEFTTKGTLKDFKQTADHRYLIGGAGNFDLVPEGGEIKADVPKTTLLPQRKLDTYGKQFSMTRQAFINDDVGFLSEVPGLYATKAKQTIDKQVYNILFNNNNIFDGKKLFSKEHNNQITTGSKPTQASIQQIILKMQQQTDPFGEPIYIVPRTMVVPVGYEFDLAVIFHSAQVPGSPNNDINPLYNYPMKVVQSPILNGLAAKGACPWFVIADPLSAPGIEVDYLNGQETPTFRRMETPGQLGFVWDIYLDWGITVLDWRGIARNDGVAIATE